MTFDVRDGGPSDVMSWSFSMGFAAASRPGAPWPLALAMPAIAPSPRTRADTRRGARPSRTSQYRIDELVLDALALAAVVTTDPVHVIGHDWGGFVAWYLAARHPQRVRTLTALSTPHPRPWPRSGVAATSFSGRGARLPGSCRCYRNLPLRGQRRLAARRAGALRPPTAIRRVLRAPHA